jgi:hypothetical protein
MSCIQYKLASIQAIVCGINPVYRLRLSDGTCVFMEWHSYCGPIFFRDRLCNRELLDWHENRLICNALDWFVSRGEKA